MKLHWRRAVSDRRVYRGKMNNSIPKSFRRLCKITTIGARLKKEEEEGDRARTEVWRTNA